MVHVPNFNENEHCNFYSVLISSQTRFIYQDSGKIFFAKFQAQGGVLSSNDLVSRPGSNWQEFTVHGLRPIILSFKQFLMLIPI